MKLKACVQCSNPERRRWVYHADKCGKDGGFLFWIPPIPMFIPSRPVRLINVGNPSEADV